MSTYLNIFKSKLFYNQEILIIIFIEAVNKQLYEPLKLSSQTLHSIFFYTISL
jgi:hypothetical protein